MDIQSLLVVILFIAALAYVGRIVYRSVSPKNNGCASNCKCGVDFTNINPQKK
ncbi:MAG: FeoB-associated Cys-rich membrane protein [Pedobacter sp.]|nr:MAG: FeoB-associated Cys-rich membrane protein [Pedobacter sp.]